MLEQFTDRLTALFPFADVEQHPVIALLILTFAWPLIWTISRWAATVGAERPNDREDG